MTFECFDTKVIKLIVINMTKSIILKEQKLAAGVNNVGCVRFLSCNNECKYVQKIEKGTRPEK